MEHSSAPCTSLRQAGAGGGGVEAGRHGAPGLFLCILPTHLHAKPSCPTGLCWTLLSSWMGALSAAPQNHFEMRTPSWMGQLCAGSPHVCRPAAGCSSLMYPEAVPSAHQRCEPGRAEAC